MGNRLLVIILLLAVLAYACRKSDPAPFITKTAPGDTPTHQYSANYLFFDSVWHDDSTGANLETFVNRVSNIFIDSTLNILVYGVDTYKLKTGTANVFESYHIANYSYATVTVTTDSVWTFGTKPIDWKNNQDDYVTGYMVK
jgi:hypothetical protein